MEGWIKIHRTLLDSAVFDNPNMLKVWIYSLLHANHKANELLWNGKKIMLLPGQFIFGRNRAAETCNMAPSTLWEQMKSLEQAGNIRIQSNNKNSLITIVNWRRYQLEDEKTDNKATANRHRQECKNERKRSTTSPETSERWRTFIDDEVIPSLIRHAVEYERSELLTDVPDDAFRVDDDGKWVEIFEDALDKWLHESVREGRFRNYFFHILAQRAASWR